MPGPEPAGQLPAASAARHGGAPIPVAQAIGWLGDWFNQELFGRPTDLPWALRIDAESRPEGYERFAISTPRWHTRRCGTSCSSGSSSSTNATTPVCRPGTLFAYYVGAYGLGPLWVEAAARTWPRCLRALIVRCADPGAAVARDEELAALVAANVFVHVVHLLTHAPRASVG